MRKFYCLFSAALFLAFLPTGAHAGSFRFGTDQHVKKIEDVQIKGKEGEDLFLGHLVETQYFLLGIYVKDGGYVLGVKNDPDGFYPLPDDGKIKEMQEAGMLPSPLPPYELAAMDYALGYSLWIALFAVAVWAGLKRLSGRKSKAAV